MAKCIVETRLFTSCYEKGDLSSELKIVGTQVFKTIKDAKTFIKSKTGEVRPWGKDFYGIKFTGKTWVEENTGEKCDEYYEYRTKKI